MTKEKIKWGELTVEEATDVFEKKLGITCEVYTDNNFAKVDVKFAKKRIKDEMLKEAYCNINSAVFRALILRHPNCPEDVKNMDKVIEEL